MGIEIGDPVVVFWGSPYVLSNTFSSRVKQLATDRLFNTLTINSFSLNEKLLPHFVSKLENHQPKLIRGYLSAILLVAQYIEQNNIKNISPVAVSTTTETLLKPYRKYLEEVFNAKIYDQYGCGECGSIAFECREHNGLHITSEHCHLDVDKENNIIVTDLDNFSQPFIRYNNGDKAIMDFSECNCGNKSPRIKNIIGRSKDNIILKDGSHVHGVFFTDIIDELDLVGVRKMLRFQVIQTQAGEIEFRIEATDAFSIKDKNLIRDSLYRFFYHVEIYINKPFFKDKSGKFKYIVSNIVNDSTAKTVPNEVLH
jgi:phenylacetate-CoA ligase